MGPPLLEFFDLAGDFTNDETLEPSKPDPLFLLEDGFELELGRDCTEPSPLERNGRSSEPTKDGFDSDDACES
jgi:hypothetical protein